MQEHAPPISSDFQPFDARVFIHVKAKRAFVRQKWVDIALSLPLFDSIGSLPNVVHANINNRHVPGCDDSESHDLKASISWCSFRASLTSHHPIDPGCPGTPGITEKLIEHNVRVATPWQPRERVRCQRGKIQTCFSTLHLCRLSNSPLEEPAQPDHEYHRRSQQADI